jgi:membrane protein YdbS with pleckstrin-like domain
MRQTSGRAGPVAVSKYLLPREVQVATVRRHPAILLLPSVMAVGGLLAAGILTATILRGSDLVWVVWLLWLVLLLNLIWKAVNWAVDYFVVTSERILLTSGLVTRNIAMMPLTKVTDMSFRRSGAGRLLGYGEFIVESAGQDQALRTIDHIPYPEQLYLLICGMLFPNSADDEDDDEAHGDTRRPVPDEL